MMRWGYLPSPYIQERLTQLVTATTRQWVPLATCAPGTCVTDRCAVLGVVTAEVDATGYVPVLTQGGGTIDMLGAELVSVIAAPALSGLLALSYLDSLHVLSSLH